MEAILDNLKEMVNEIQNLLEDLLLNHSSIYRWNEPGGAVIVLSTSGDYAYRELGEAGRRIQSKLLEEYRRFHALLGALLREQPKDSLELLSDSHKLLLQTIEQESTWCSSTREALDKAVEALQNELKLLHRLYDPSEGEVILVPDTNALLYNPKIETWAFESVPKHTILLAPTILSELDVLKINHRNEAVRKKAETLIRQVKEYRRRGRLTEGVPLVKGVATVSAVATEPNMEDSLPWLDPGNNDDRFLASVLEVMRSRPQSAVVIVTRDINLQNKAEFARIPFIEPPEPMTD